MTYRETPAGARILAAGALDFGGSALQAPVTTTIESLWTWLSRR